MDCSTVVSLSNAGGLDTRLSSLCVLKGSTDSEGRSLVVSIPDIGRKAEKLELVVVRLSKGTLSFFVRRMEALVDANAERRAR